MPQVSLIIGISASSSGNPACEKATWVPSAVPVSSQVMVVPAQWGGNTPTFTQITRFSSAWSRRSRKGSGTPGKLKYRTSSLRFTSSVHQPVRPSCVLSASRTRDGSAAMSVA